MEEEGSGPEAWDRIYAGLNALDLGTDLAWDLFLGLWLVCIGVAMLRHSRLGLRWGVPALALVPPFFAFNVAATPDPPAVDLGPLIGMYLTVLSVWLVWLRTSRAGLERPRRSQRSRKAVSKRGDSSTQPRRGPRPGRER